MGEWYPRGITKKGIKIGSHENEEGLVSDPCIPSDWKEFRVVRRWRGATFNITVKNPNGVQKGIKTIKRDGELVRCPIPPQRSGSVHEMLVVIG